MIAPEEQRHLTVGPRPGEVAAGAGTVCVFARGGDGGGVLERSRAVMLAILEHSGSQWPTVEEWSSLLPPWFVGACAPEMSREEAERWLSWWRSLGPAERARTESERRWTLADWLYWLTPSERQWFWWDAEVDEGGELRIAIEVEGWPTALGALDWLLRAAGAMEIIHEEGPLH